MDSSKIRKNPNPRENANLLSVLFFAYVIPLLKKGYIKDLEEIDLYDPLPEDLSKVLGDRLEAKWKLQLKKKTPSLLRATLATFWRDILKVAFMLGFVELIFGLSQPILLGQFLIYFKVDSTMQKGEALFYAVAMIAVNLSYAFAANHYLLNAFHLGMKVRVACCSVIYRKTLRLSKMALGDTVSGKVVNLLSNDVSRFDILMPLVNYVWVSPIVALIILYVICSRIGYAGVIGMVVVFIVVPIQVYVGKLSSKYRLQTAYKTDERIRLMEEIISGVQVIKMYAWEYPFLKLIKFARQAELNIIRKNAYVRGLYMTFGLVTSRCAIFATIVFMILVGFDISADQIFVFQSYFLTLSLIMSGMFVRGISELAESLVAFKRLQIFMMYDEFEEKPLDILPQLNREKKPLPEIKPTPDDMAVKIVDISAKWNAASTENILNDINLMVAPGRLVGIIGPVGSGKSSLLQSILGELQITNGSITISGKISYASQEPWVFAASVRQNILFGETYDKVRYSTVVRVCALKKDFEQLPHGDMTIVGDRGASLSGGQKARINLARAVYRKADIYLLDDPLSAVDTHVGKHLFDQCINDFLAMETRILVTHQLQYMKDADHLLILKDGRIGMQGTFTELVNSDLDYAQMLIAEPQVDGNDQKLEQERAIIVAPTIIHQKTVPISNMLQTLDVNEDAELKAKHAEQTSKGTVKGNLLIKYFISGGNFCVVFIIVFLFLLAQGLGSGCDYFVSFWINEEELRRFNKSDRIREPIFTQNVEIYIYTSLIVGLLIFGLARSFSYYMLCIRCSQKLHNQMFVSIIRTSMRFFDTNPTGRILNRFSKDIGVIDELLTKAILDTGQILLFMLSSVILTTIIYPYFLMAIMAIAIIFHYDKKVYLKTSKNIKRMEGITRSPIFTHLNATLQGLTSIRAYGAQRILRDEFDQHQDLNSGAWFMFISSSSAFGFSLDILCSIFITTVILVFVLIIDIEETTGNIGLVITQSMALMGLVQWGMRQSAEVQNHLMSVERVLEYTELEPEPNFDSDQPLAQKWPSKARIEFVHTYMKYVANEAFVLKDLNLVIQPSEKIGIVGRTGAGKSSLIVALFRLALVEGKILIDGVDTKDIDLQNLRKGISIIPQDPVLFSGTIRRNLDPFEEYPDSLLWSALEDVQLKDMICAENNLETQVMDHGSNFSVGQRQLICLARTIIRNNRILVLDEATANVDPQTDSLIQKTIRQKFATCTVLTVAHRLNTVMDADKILVMNAGQMVQFDHPHILCQNKEGNFYKMVEETGPVMTEQLCQIAQKAYDNTFSNVTCSGILLKEET